MFRLTSVAPAQPRHYFALNELDTLEEPSKVYTKNKGDPSY